MKIFLIILLLILITLLTFALIYGGFYLYNLALNPIFPKDLIFPKSKESTKQDETSGVINDESQKWFFEKSDYLDMYINTKDGLKLHNYLIKNPIPTNKWAIVTHGYTSQGKLMSSYTKNFFDMGFNILVPDLRGHGQSEGNYIGMGWLERLDIIALINYLTDNYPNSEIVLFGISMGASTVMNVSGESLPKNIKAIIEDCGYTSTWAQFSYHLKKMFKLPPFPMLYISSLICKLKNGFWISDGSSLDQVKESKTPILFIHGDKDSFVPFFMVKELYDTATVEKDLLIIKDASHAKASYVNPTVYWDTIETFINKHLS